MPLLNSVCLEQAPVVRPACSDRAFRYPAQVDEPIFQPAGDFLTVTGMLRALNVAEAPLEDQRAAVRRMVRLDSVGPVLRPLIPELRRLGLI